MYTRFFFSIVSLLWSFFFLAIWGVGSHGHFSFNANQTGDVLIVIGFYSGLGALIFIWVKYFFWDLNKKSRKE